MVSTILFIDELDANYFLCMFISILYMFRAYKCSSSGDSIVSIRHLVYVTLCRWLSGMQVWTFRPNLHTGQSHTQSDIYQMYWYNWISWWWVLVCSKHVENWNKHIQKIIGRNVQTCIPDSHLHRVTYTRCRIDTIESPDDEHLYARNM